VSLAQTFADALEALEVRTRADYLALLTQRDDQLTHAEFLALLDAATGDLGRKKAARSGRKSRRKKAAR
jgi:hypothetical protein